MKKMGSSQPSLFPEHTAIFPSTRYQGSKAKIADWIWSEIAELNFKTCLDAFGGTGAVAYRLKQAGKQVTYNDLLKFNYYFGLAIIENSHIKLSDEQTEWILQKHSGINYPCFIQNTFKDIYFTEQENQWLDQTITNIKHIKNPYKIALAFFALCQACIIKRPYNLFHRKNLYIRLANVERSFGNKTTWDRPFEEWFRIFIEEVNNAVFDNGQKNRALNSDACEVSGEYDLVYIDPPYISKNGVGVDYLDFYHFLEGLTMYYEEWHQRIDYKSKHRRLKLLKNPWNDPKEIFKAFDRLFNRFRESILVVSYRSDGIPNEQQLVSLLKKYKKTVTLKHFGRYKYVLSKNNDSKEILLIGN